MSSVNAIVESSVWNPPSEEIRRLFRFNTDELPPSDDKLQSVAKAATHPHSFSEDEFEKIPSTLMKAIRRTDALLHQNENMRKAAIDNHNELKAIHSLIVRYARKHLKFVTESTAATETNKTAIKGFQRPCRISDAMCEFIGKPVGSETSRVEVNNLIHTYIKTRQLIDPENAQRILPDERLWELLSENAKGNNITYFSIQKYITHHFLRD